MKLNPSQERTLQYHPLLAISKLEEFFILITLLLKIVISLPVNKGFPLLISYDNGTEVKNQTISVNNPLRYQNIDFYQSDWNLLGIRIKDDATSNKIYEVPLFSLKDKTKAWITWIEDKNGNSKTLVFDQLQNIFTLYDPTGKFIKSCSLGDTFDNKQIIEIIPATGLQIKYDPSIAIIYAGFGLLMITAYLSYLP